MTWSRFPRACTQTGSSRWSRLHWRPSSSGLVQHVAAYERLAVQAALSDDPADVRKALLAHPLIGQWDAAKELAELLRAASEARV